MLPRQLPAVFRPNCPLPAKPSTFFTPPQQLRNAAPSNITVFAPRMQLPTVHEWNFGIQRELPGGFVMQASYIGRRGEHLFMAYDKNQIKVEPILDSFLKLQANNRAPNCLPSGANRDNTKPACVPVFTVAQIPLLAA